MRFPRAIRLDTSDRHAYEVAAELGEWAAPAAFAFANTDQEPLTGKARRAFSHGFLGAASFGRTTLVEVAEIDPAGYEEVVRRLAVQREFGENGVVERFKVIRPPKDGRLARSWTVVEDDTPG